MYLINSLSSVFSGNDEGSNLGGERLKTRLMKQFSMVVRLVEPEVEIEGIFCSWLHKLNGLRTISLVTFHKTTTGFRLEAR